MGVEAFASPLGRYRPAPTVRHFQLGRRTAFFCERAQCVFELNDTADLIWRTLEQESTPEAASRALIQRGADPAKADAYVAEQLRAWLRGGYWSPSDVPHSGPTRTLRWVIDELRAEVAGDEETIGRLAHAFDHFPRFSGPADVHLRLARWEEGYHLFDGTDYLGSVTPEELTPRVKAVLTEMVIRRPTDGFFAHAALLEREGCTLMLSGPPGAGKSTLAMALSAAGYRLLSDDVVKVHPDGRVQGVPFAPALKRGAWKLLADAAPGLEDLPVERRTDGQWVRYAHMDSGRQAPRVPNLFLALARQDGAAAEAHPMNPLEALSIVLADGFSEMRRLSASLMGRLVERFSGVDCRRLSYSDLKEATGQIERLRHGL